MPEIFVFGGCNGSGKTTFANNFLNTAPNIEYVNADTIAAQLNPSDVEAVAIQASRMMLTRLNALATSGVDFAFETTLAARSFAKFLRECKNRGYQINLVYVWLSSVELAIDRVAARVASGGHNIPETTIIRRYNRGRRNFIELYMPIADRWRVYDNSEVKIEPIAYCLNSSQTPTILQPNTWNKIINY